MEASEEPIEHWWQIKVIDKGIGISEAGLKDLFKAFYKTKDKKS